jgi:hypothetical protein
MTMEEQLITTVEKLASKYGFIYWVLARMDGTVVHRRGSQEVLRWKGPLESLFGDSKAVSNTYSSLQNQLSPQLFSQGQTCCVHFRPLPGYVLGLFQQDQPDAVLRFTEAEKFMKEVLKV